MFAGIFNECGNQSPGPSAPPCTQSLIGGSKAASQNSAIASGSTIASGYRNSKKIRYPTLDSKLAYSRGGSASDVEIPQQLRGAHPSGDLEELRPTLLCFVNRGRFAVCVGLH